MKEMKILEFEKMSKYKTYGNKYLQYYINSITRDEYLVASICTERKIFPYTIEGHNQMKKWINEKRLEIGKCLNLFEDEE